ncbi:hypothetical protein GUJ93_ZPchr0002g24099 [Zizania palustris]|uniref:Uncharacterized protein n=1 Tax=Zizania palustris TaxID=103762 RepID=A0A8J5S229_ZIZPA|nr:hypothetical protein GUJ93_ZPchr0002g24099 [Zizania palustris]
MFLDIRNGHDDYEPRASPRSTPWWAGLIGLLFGVIGWFVPRCGAAAWAGNGAACGLVGAALIDTLLAFA